MAYVPVGAGLPGGFPIPGGLPGPPSRAVGPIGPTMPTSIFPTTLRVGEPVNITGPFGTLGFGSVRVKFVGAPWINASIIGPATATVIVPRGAQNGLCEVEINGRRAFGTNCTINPGVVQTRAMGDAPLGVQIPMALVGLGLLAGFAFWLKRGGVEKLHGR